MRASSFAFCVEHQQAAAGCDGPAAAAFAGKLSERFVAQVGGKFGKSNVIIGVMIDISIDEI